MTTTLDALIRASDDTQLKPAKAVAALAQLVDQAGDAGRLDAIEVGILWAGRLLAGAIPEADRARVHYFTANAHAIRRSLKRTKAVSQCAAPDLRDEIRHLRSALQCAGWPELHPNQQCQVLTNLGNAMSRCGRLVEALEWYDAASVIEPSFGMRLANRGLVLTSYGRLVHHHSRRVAIVRAAHADLSRALTLPLEGKAEALVGTALTDLETRAPAQFSWAEDEDRGTLEEWPPELSEFRSWALRERLFLDELNDLGTSASATADMLVLPSYVTPLGEGPGLIGSFNQIKQEYVAARWMLFEGLADRPHPADVGVVVADTLDYPAHSYRTEQLRLAYRSAYSLLDKVAYFLNEYLQLGIAANDVAFRTMWFAKPKATRLRRGVESALSGPLQALIWVSQDLFDPGSAYGAALQPDAQDLWELRRHLEHRYLKLHREPWRQHSTDAHWDQGLRDDLALSLSRVAFAQKALRLMKLVRASLIYLTGVMTVEEARRRQARDPKAITPPMWLPTLDR